MDKFNINNIGIGSSIYILGKCCVGKTTLVKDILKKINLDFDNFLVIAIDDYTDLFHKSTTNDNRLVDKYDNRLVDKFLDLSMKNSKTNKKSLMIFDDCLRRTHLRNNAFHTIINYKKSMNLIPIFTNQYLSDMPRNLRYHMNYTFIFKETMVNNIKRIYEEYFTEIYNTLSDFYKFFTNFFKKEDYKCLVIEKNYNGKHNIYWYKADINNIKNKLI